LLQKLTWLEKNSWLDRRVQVRTAIGKDIKK